MADYRKDMRSSGCWSRCARSLVQRVSMNHKVAFANGIMSFRRVLQRICSRTARARREVTGGPRNVHLQRARSQGCPSAHPFLLCSLLVRSVGRLSVTDHARMQTCTLGYCTTASTESGDFDSLARMNLIHLWMRTELCADPGVNLKHGQTSATAS